MIAKIIVTVITVMLINCNARTSDNNQICDTKIAEVDLCWFESYDRNFAIKSGVQIPVYSNLNGTQDQSDYRAKLTFVWHF